MYPRDLRPAPFPAFRGVAGDTPDYTADFLRGKCHYSRAEKSYPTAEFVLCYPVKGTFVCTANVFPTGAVHMYINKPRQHKAVPALNGALAVCNILSQSGNNAVFVFHIKPSEAFPIGKNESVFSTVVPIALLPVIIDPYGYPASYPGGILSFCRSITYFFLNVKHIYAIT